MDAQATPQDWILTHCGEKFRPLADDPGPIHIADISHALSNVCRYAGHVRFYSVAEHSVRLSTLVGLISVQRNDRARVTLELEKYALMHDAAEAYLGDMPAPLKERFEMRFYREAELKLQTKIYGKFGLDAIPPREIAELDVAIRDMERVALSHVHRENIPATPIPQELGDPSLFGWSPASARGRFVDRFLQLWQKRPVVPT